MNKAFLFLSLIATVLLSCEKPDKALTKDPPHRLKGIYGNPMDSIGANHNSSLDEIDKIAVFPYESPQTDFDTIASIMGIPGSPSYTFVDSLYKEEMNISFDSAITMMYIVNKINRAQKEMLEELDSIIIFSGTNDSVLKYNVSNFEDEIYLNTSLTKNRSIILYGAAAVLKYSCDYWTTVASNSSNPWHSFGGAAMPRWVADTRGWFWGFNHSDGMHHADGSPVNPWEAGAVVAAYCSNMVAK